jgi:hypothetical protein
MGNVAFADELVDEINASEEVPEDDEDLDDDDLDGDGDGEDKDGIKPEGMPQE